MKIETDQGDDCKLVDNNMIAIDLSKEQAFDADPKAIQQINFTGKVDQTGTTTVFFIIEEAKKKTVQIFLKEPKFS